MLAAVGVAMVLVLMHALVLVLMLPLILALALVLLPDDPREMISMHRKVTVEARPALCT